MTTHLKSEHKRKASCQSSFSRVNENHQKEHTSTGGEVQTQAVFTHKRIPITKPLDVQSATPNMETECSPSPQKPKNVGNEFWGHGDGQRQRRIGVHLSNERFIKLERDVEDLQTRVIAMEGHEQQTEQRSKMPQMDRDWVTCDSNDTINDTEEVEGSNDSSDGQHRVERTVKKKRRPSYSSSRYPTHSRCMTTTSPGSFLSGTHNSLGRKGSPPSLPENVDNSHNVVSADGSVVTVNYHINNHHHRVVQKKRY
jgi:hypothetical protein